MPSPIGHLLAGLAVGWSTEPETGSTPPRWCAFGHPPFTRFALGCAALATLPDADLLIPATHRTATHSLTATFLVLIITALVTRQVTGKTNWGMACALALAQATHVVTDWLGADPFPPAGVQLLWPFDPRFFISPVQIFPGVERNLSKPEVISANVYAAVVELLLMGPVAWIALGVRRRRTAKHSGSARESPRRSSESAI